MRAPRKQAHRLTEWLTRDKPSLRAVLLGARREGKSDLLAQTHQLLFSSAEGPLPFWFRFEPITAPDAAAQARQALRFAAAFCHQMRAFLLRQEELLSETPGSLASELERPGIPLALNELGREILSAAQSHASGEELVGMVSRLPVGFAHREGRPVCHLWDDCHTLELNSPYVAALDALTAVPGTPPLVCALLTGFAPQMRALTGRHHFTALPLQPFALSEALLMAESACKSSDVLFNRELWESWFALAGTSPGWAVPLIESAGLQGELLESLEQLGRLYAAELEGGSLGSWLAERWPLPAPAHPAQALSPQAIATLLANQAAPSLTLPDSAAHEDETGQPDVATSLDRQEWLRLRPFSAENSLSPVETDWLRLETDRTTLGAARARARLLQDFLLRAHRRQQAQEQLNEQELSLEAIEEHLLYPPAPGASITTAAGDELRLPEISSVVRETTAEGELFWCFGEALAAKPARRSATGAAAAQKTPPQKIPIVLLIAHAESSPAKAMVAEWSRRLQQEVIRPGEPASALRTELWVVLPASASLAPTGNEKRLSREMLNRLLTSVTQDDSIGQPEEAEPVPPAHANPAVEEIGKRLAELQARAQWLQQEFRSSQKGTAPAPPTNATPAADKDRRNEYLRQALSLSLMLASADLAATGTAPGDRSGESLADLQRQCQKLLDQLHTQASRDDRTSNLGKTTPLPPARS